VNLSHLVSLIGVLSTLISLENNNITHNCSDSIQSASVNFVKATPKPYKYIVIIDAGHGGKDVGCSASGLLEKDITLPFSKLIGAKIKYLSQDINVIFTRTKDQSISLTRRYLMANDIGADAFISVHANAIDNPKVKGFETYIYGKSPVENKKFHSHSTHNVCLTHVEKDIKKNIRQSTIRQGNQSANIKLAQAINNKVSQLRVKNRGLKQAEFQVLKHIEIPSVLIEVGYLTNENDRQLIKDKAQQNRMAHQIALGIIEFVTQLQ